MLSKKSLCMGAVIGLYLTYTFLLTDFFALVHSANGRAMAEAIFTTILYVVLFLFSIPLYSFFVFYFSDKHRNKFKEKAYALVSDNKFYYACYGLAAISLIIQIRYAFSPDLFCDEGFSLGLICNSYGDVIKGTAIDVHPPLYYLILKPCVELIHMLMPKLNIIYISKLLSIIPYILLAAICSTRVKRLWGKHISVLCTLFLFGFPCVMEKILEIRMYGWGMFFVFSAYMEFCSIIKYERKRSWIFFVLYSLGAAYTHYFACVSVAFLYIAALVYYLIRKNTTQLKCWLCGAVATVLLYLPWFIVVITQMANVKKDYWIPELRLEYIIGYFKFAMANRFVIGIVLLCAVLFIKSLLKKAAQPGEALLAVSAVGVNLWTVAFSVIASLAFSPVFVDRYMIPSMLCLWFGIIYIAELTKSKAFKFFISIIVFFVSMSGIYSFNGQEREKLVLSRQSCRIIDEISASGDVVFATNSRSVYWVLPSLTDCRVYHLASFSGNKEESYAVKSYLEVSDRLYDDKSAGVIYSEDKLISELKDNKAVYFIPVYSDNVEQFKNIGYEQVDVPPYKAYTLFKLSLKDTKGQ